MEEEKRISQLDQSAASKKPLVTLMDVHGTKSIEIPITNPNTCVLTSIFLEKNLHFVMRVTSKSGVPLIKVSKTPQGLLKRIHRRLITLRLGLSLEKLESVIPLEYKSSAGSLYRVMNPGEEILMPSREMFFRTNDQEFILKSLVIQPDAQPHLRKSSGNRAKEFEKFNLGNGSSENSMRIQRNQDRQLRRLAGNHSTPDRDAISPEPNRNQEIPRSSGSRSERHGTSMLSASPKSSQTNKNTQMEEMPTLQRLRKRSDRNEINETEEEVRRLQSLGMQEFNESLLKARNQETNQRKRRVLKIAEDDDAMEASNEQNSQSKSEQSSQRIEEMKSPREAGDDKQYKRLKKIVSDKRESKRADTTNSHEGKADKSKDCAICLGNLKNDIGHLPCAHVFCFSCIADWADITNLCPLCKREFRLIERRDHTGHLMENRKVAKREQTFEDEIEWIIDENCDEHCYECLGEDDSINMLVCDGCSWYCCHIYCLDPPLDHVPNEPWYCKYCQAMSQADRQQARAHHRVRPSTVEEPEEEDDDDEIEESVEVEPQQRRPSRQETRSRRTAHREDGPMRVPNQRSRLVQDIISTVLMNMNATRRAGQRFRSFRR